MRRLLVLVVLGVIIGGTIGAGGSLGGAAAGATTARQQAKSTGDRLVARLLQSDHSCDERSDHGYFGKGASYLASCDAKDGSFRFIVVVPVRTGGLNVDTAYIRARIDDTCADAGGAVYSAGVRGRFVVMYLGRGSAAVAGSGASVAVGLWNGLLDQLQETSGTFRSGEICAGGRVLQKLA